MDKRLIEREKWKPIVREFYSSNLRQIDWCRENGIRKDDLYYRRVTFEELGIMDDLIEWADGFTLCGYAEGQYLTCRREGLDYAVHFITQPLVRTGIDSAAWTIRSCLNRDPSDGDLYLFRRPVQRELTAYRNNGKITMLQKIRANRGYVFYWPLRMADSTHARISKDRLEFILNSASVF